MSDAPSPEEAVRTARAPLPNVVEREVSGGVASRDPFMHRAGGVAPEVRDSILSSLYDERKMLLRQRRAAPLSLGDVARLTDLEGYINRWERTEEQGAADDVWRKLEALAGRVVAIGAAAERQPR